MSLFKRNYLYDNAYFVKNAGGIIVREVTIKVADEKDFEFVEVLQSLGVNRKAAKLITYLKDVERRLVQGYRDGHRLEAARGQHSHGNPEGDGMALGARGQESWKG